MGSETTPVPRIYADFNGVVAGVRRVDRSAVVLDEIRTVQELANAGVVLRNDLPLIVYDGSDDEEDLEGHGAAFYDRLRRRWVAELDERGVQYVPKKARALPTEFRCVGCRRDLGPQASVIRSAGVTCPSCGTSILEPIAAPKFHNEIPASWISRRTSSPEAVRRKFPRHPQLHALLHAMQLGDELRGYCSPRAGWAKRAGSRGYVVIRDGEVLARVVTARA